MPSGTATTFLDALRDARILSSTQQDEVRTLQSRIANPRALAKELIQRGWLTPYQVNQLFLGKGSELVMGAYSVLERLGEGGTGQVFKARHMRMERTVALKLIRQELLSDPEVVGRFYREVQVLSQLSHPNIVHAYDAGPLGAAHFLVMEYVEGTDLSAMVKKQGPLGWEQSCDYISQAAQGLQHAHERALVHRDIKPSNLLVTRDQGPKAKVNVAEAKIVSDAAATQAIAAPVLHPWGQVKLLDLGLARLRKGVDGELTQTLTPVGAGAVTMGTPDYLAPEQALDFHQVDIRADIYGLGCTLYYLLTGKPPFAGGTLAQKLMRHQQVEAPSLKQSRTDLPAGLEPILRKMMAKKPEDRYQTPAQVATALATLTGGNSTLAWPRRGTHLSERGRRRRWVLAGGGLVLLGAGGVLLRGVLSGSSAKPGPSSSDEVVKAATTVRMPGTTLARPESLPWSRLAGLIRPSGDEDKWAQIPWMINLWDARQRAAREGKPILLWDTDGHPLGSACGNGIADRAVAFSYPDVIGAAQAHFVCVATEDWYQRRRTDSEGQFFRAMADQGPRKGENDAPRHGIYVLTAEGKFLAFGFGGHSGESIVKMLRQGLGEWNKLPENQRKPGAVTIPAPGAVDSRFHRSAPAGGRIVNTYTRILEREGNEWRRGTTTVVGGAAAARDHLWMLAEEVKTLITAGKNVGDKFAVPSTLTDRIARFHLVDNTRGHPGFWRRDEIRSLTMTVTVTEITSGQVRMRLDGHVLLASNADPSQAERGFDVQFSGSLMCEAQRRYLAQFDVVAVGEHWGESGYSKGARPGRSWLGIAFNLGGANQPFDLVPPGGARDMHEYFPPGAR
ncbi:MAG: serine/threonine protein kinase [Gemmataceae bacterium]|nr:serine/threonine protein kinase [Gemmataceae bacterium]